MKLEFAYGFSFAVDVQSAARADKAALAIIVLLANGLAVFLEPASLQHLFANLTSKALAMIELVLGTQRLLVLDLKLALKANLLKQPFPLFLTVHFTVFSLKRIASPSKVLATCSALDVISVIRLAKRRHAILGTDDAFLTIPALRNTRQNNRRCIDLHIKIICRKILVVIVKNSSSHEKKFFFFKISKINKKKKKKKKKKFKKNT
jgi:hypothetical protein